MQYYYPGRTNGEVADITAHRKFGKEKEIKEVKVKKKVLKNKG